MSKFKKLYLPLFVSVAMNIGNMYASAEEGNDPRDEADKRTASPLSLSSAVPVTLIPTSFTDETDEEINTIMASAEKGNNPRDETNTSKTSSSDSSSTVSVTRVSADLIYKQQINALVNEYINMLNTKISRFSIIWNTTKEGVELEIAAAVSGQGKEYAPLKEYQLRMVSTYADKILATGNSKFTASAQLIKDSIQKLLPQVSTITSESVDKITHQFLILAELHRTFNEFSKNK